MLVGRPPYESRDVKSTYRRILANVYSFPDNINISDNAKSLIRRMLQVLACLHYTLANIFAHTPQCVLQTQWRMCVLHYCTAQCLSGVTAKHTAAVVVVTCT
jgi:serine/threonine protein kinase